MGAKWQFLNAAGCTTLSLYARPQECATNLTRVERIRVQYTVRMMQKSTFVREISLCGLCSN